jgi:hypothetical protein
LRYEKMIRGEPVPDNGSVLFGWMSHIQLSPK